MAGGGGGGAGMHVRDVVRMVVGSDGVADTERDLPNRDEGGRVRLRGEHQHDLHFRDSAGVPVDAVPHEGANILLLLGVDTGDGAVCAVPAAGDEGDPDRPGGGEAVEAASGVEELLQRRWPL